MKALSFLIYRSSFRAIVNITGDCVGVAVVEKLSIKFPDGHASAESKEPRAETTHLNNTHQENHLPENI